MSGAPEFMVEAWQDGAAFQVKAHAGSRREGVSGFHDGMLRLDVTAAPEKGKANKAIIKLLANILDVPAANIELLSGDTNTRKRFGVRGITPDTVRRRIHI